MNSNIINSNYVQFVCPCCDKVYYQCLKDELFYRKMHSIEKHAKWVYHNKHKC